MIIVKNKDWNQNYSQIVIDCINDCFPPEKHFVDIDGSQLIESRRWYEGDDNEEIIRDFTGKSWDQIDHALISYHRAASAFMSYHGFVKFLPAFLIDLFDEDCQLDTRVLDFLLTYYLSDGSPTPHEYELNDDQIICCLLTFLEPIDFPIDTNMPNQSNEESYYAVKPEWVFPALTQKLHPRRLSAIRSKIEELNTWFLENC